MSDKLQFSQQDVLENIFDGGVNNFRRVAIELDPYNDTGPQISAIFTQLGPSKTDK